MPSRETPEEWARRTGKNLSLEELDAQTLMDRIPDALRFRVVAAPEAMISTVRSVLDDMQGDMQGDEVYLDFIGNWWVEGNPYKGLNCVLVIRDMRLNFEIQFHTDESAEVADANHPDYEIFRDRTQPLEARQAAFDRMVARSAGLVHPPGIEALGTPVKAVRPVAPPPDPTELLRGIAEQQGFKLNVQQSEYREDLKALLEKGRAAFRTRQFRSAIVMFDELVEAFHDDPDVWSQRGVANALTHSGQALMELERFAEAIERFDRVIEMAASDEEVELEGLRAEDLKQAALKRQRTAAP